MKTYTTGEVAKILKITRRTLYSWIKQGKVKVIRVGRKWLITEAEIKRLLGE